jgi:predicted DNA-binding transcriptional regulator AlpA
MSAKPEAAPVITMRPLYIERAQIPLVLTLSESSWDTLVARGEAPRPRKISAGRSGWLLEEIEAWARARPVSDLLPPKNSGFGRAGKRKIAEA